MAFISSGPRKGSRYHRLDDIPMNTFTPRTYQIQLLDSALKRNTLLCLGSAESKVFLGLMVAKEKASVTRLPLQDGGKRTFYLTDTDEDTEFLKHVLPNHTDLSIGSCSNLTESAETWLAKLKAHNILVCPGETFLQAVSQAWVKLPQVNLLIFDNCHRCVQVEDHPYSAIVAQVTELPSLQQPLILGLTASIAGTKCSDPNTLRDTITAMESSMNAYAETSMLILSERFGCRPKEVVVKCQEEFDDSQTDLKDLLESLLVESYDFFMNCKIPIDDEVDNRDPRETPLKVITECLNILEVLGSWCTSSIGEYFVMQIDKIIKCEKNDIHKKFLRCVTTTLRRMSKEFENNFHPGFDVDELLEYTTTKIRELIKVLRNYKPEVDFMIICDDVNSENDDDFSDLSDDDDSLGLDSDGEDEGKGSPNHRSPSKPIHIAIKRTPDGGHERITTFTEEEEKNLCGVVFVESRYVAFGLSKIVEEVCAWDENLCYVKPCYITGQGAKGVSRSKANKAYKRQEEALRKFRTQECNLIIATKELEEGVDIPRCNLVVRFDPPKDYRSYTLSKGRARARESSFVILLDDENYQDFSSDVGVFKEIEKVLMGDSRVSNLRVSSEDSDADEEADGDDDSGTSEEEEEDMFPPYCTPAGSQVSLKTAIGLINRYCAKLPTDAFTHLTPQCRMDKLGTNPVTYQAHLRLPINSPIKKELPGPVVKTRKLAKKSVALKMCRVLHMKGELDDKLVPVGKEMYLCEQQQQQQEEDEEEDGGEDDGDDYIGQARPGTTKRKQYYVKKVADAFAHSEPKADQPCHLYLVNLRLTGPITDDQNTRGRVIYAPQDSSRSLGILLDKDIPNMPQFPVYTRSGEVTVSLDLLRADLVLSSEELGRLQQFHHFVFSDVLHLIKDPMDFQPLRADFDCLIVPLNGSDQLSIEWEFVSKVIEFSNKLRTPASKAKGSPEPFQFSLEEFQDAVVMPSYRNIDQPQHFYVAEIKHDLNPLSPFPSPELYKTFQNYYTTKYGLKITNTDQPLLDVDHTSARLNLLTPRYMTQKGLALPTSSAHTKRARRENLQQKQILVPELCSVHVFPASLWRKTVCLPAILYRANCLLLAEELRRKIAKETGIGLERLPEGFQFAKLNFGFETSPEKLKGVESGSKPSDEQEEPDGDKSGVSGSDGANTLEDTPLEEIRSEASEPREVVSDDAEDSKDKTDSSSDSDSGIASSSSDSNIGPSKDSQTPQLPCTSVKTGNVCVSQDTESMTVLNKSCMSETCGVADLQKAQDNVDQALLSSPIPRCVQKIPVCNQVPNHSEVPGDSSEQCKPFSQDPSTGSSNNQAQISTTTVIAAAQPPSTRAVVSECNSPHPLTGSTGDRPATTLSPHSHLPHPPTPHHSTVVPAQPEKEFGANCGADPQTTMPCKSSSSPSTNQYNKASESYCNRQAGSTSLCTYADNPTTSDDSHLTNGICEEGHHSPHHVAASNPPLSSSSSSSNSNVNLHDCKPTAEPAHALGHGEEACCDRNAPSTLPAPTDTRSGPMDSSAIIMNTLEAELRQQLDIDLLCPGTERDTFQSHTPPGFDMATSNQTTQQQDEQSFSTEGKQKNFFEKKVDADADLIKFSFNVESPKAKTNVKIDTWSTEGSPGQQDKAAGESKQSPKPAEQTKCKQTTPAKKDGKDFSIGVWAKKPAASIRAKSKACLPVSPSPEDSEGCEENRPTGPVNGHMGPSPCLILQALTMSNANDFFSLERLETIGDSFLKYAITVYLYCSYPGIHEGKLSYLRSKQVSNYNLYRLGRRKGLAENLVSTKFEPYENWLPPGYIINEDRRRGPVPKVRIALSSVSAIQGTKTAAASTVDEAAQPEEQWAESVEFQQELECLQQSQAQDQVDLEGQDPQVSPYSLQCLQALPDKSLADCVEALIGCYLTTCGRKATLVFMSWLGLKVLPKKRDALQHSGGRKKLDMTSWWKITEQQFDELRCPASPMQGADAASRARLEALLEGFDQLEDQLGYRFRDRSYLLQAFTHASYHYNTITECYQRVEFLGDAILDYVITRHLYEDSKKYSPGILTDLRSALVNNNIFAALAVKWGFHKYFKAISPSLFAVIDKFVGTQMEKNQDDIDIDEEFRQLEEGEEVCEEDDDTEEVEMEIPKALGDIFESVAGAIYLDSGMSLDAVWSVYYRMMKPHIDKYLKSIPKSPVRELLETEPETAKFDRPERTMNGKVRVTVNVVGKGEFTGVGRNYRIAKSAAANKALRHIRMLNQSLLA